MPLEPQSQDGSVVSFQLCIHLDVVRQLLMGEALEARVFVTRMRLGSVDWYVSPSLMVVFGLEAIKKAHAMGKTLYVASMELRMIYEKMTYIIRHEGDLSDLFISTSGVLIGDTASPELWLLYLADFSIPESEDDILIDSFLISQLEQTDDALLLSLSPDGIQGKMSHFDKWCRRDFLFVM
ncbi:hypothetical protein C8J56DRAFT_1164571 [Mycena floridula]|nr:hypothetical protein C8J56DRAFT_1164571 [Mycena floridula]